MTYLIILAKLINIIAVLLFTAGLFFVCDKEINTKHKANLGIAMGLVMVLYILLLSLVLIVSIWKQHFLALILLVFMIVPFPLGHYSKFETVKLFTIIQIMCFIMSLAVLYLI